VVCLCKVLQEYLFLLALK